MPTATPQLLYPRLRGDLDADPRLLERLNKLAHFIGKTFTVTSGKRTRAEQQALYDARGSNPYPVAAPGTSSHESGLAADVLVDGRPIQDAISADVLRRSGLDPLAGDAVHVQLAGVKADGTRHSLADDLDGALDSATGAIGGAAASVAGDAAKATAKAAAGVLVDAIGRDGARVLVSVALVLVAVAAIAAGGARALGLRTPPIPALAALKGLR